MCRMMALLAKDGIKASWLTTFMSLAIHGKIRCDMTEPGHKDGWGLVSYFQEDFPKYLAREPHSILQDEKDFKSAAKVLEVSRSKIVLTHLRKTSVGCLSISNTHPFLYKEWAFAHNGTIYDHEKIFLKKLKPAGSTDSERFFLYLMEHLENSHPRNQDEILIELRKATEEIKRDFQVSSLTFLLTNGKMIFAFRDCDSQFRDYYTLYSTEIGENKIFCSEPLMEIASSWDLLENKSFIWGGQ